jgi:hypothetical protein
MLAKCLAAAAHFGLARMDSMKGRRPFTEFRQVKTSPEVAIKTKSAAVWCDALA